MTELLARLQSSALFLPVARLHGPLHSTVSLCGEMALSKSRSEPLLIRRERGGCVVGTHRREGGHLVEAIRLWPPGDGP